MRRVVLLLGLSLVWTALLGMAWAEPKIISHNGSLVIVAPDAKKLPTNQDSQDTLYDLLGQEVQVYIFNNKARIWPRVYAHVTSVPWAGRQGPRNPRIDALIRKYSQIYGVDPSLVRAVMRHESDFNPLAVSPKGAEGLMQLMPGTAALMGVKNPFDPEQNIAGGVGYLRFCLDRFQHNVPLAIAAYNAGPESVAKCGTIPPYKETRTFVSNVMGSYTGIRTGVSQPQKSSDTAGPPRPKIIIVHSHKTKSRDRTGK
jgi:soluble lytic murein transglycosylase-like protein